MADQFGKDLSGDYDGETSGGLSEVTSSDVLDTLQTIIGNLDGYTGDKLSYVLGSLTAKYGISKIQDRVGGLSEADLQEPLLNPANQKFTAFPIKYQGIWDLYKAQ